MAAVANGQGDVQGEADSDKVVEPVTAAILGAAAKGMKGKPGAEVQATAGDTKKPELTASATRVATASELGAGEKSESGEKQARQSSPMTAEVDDVALADSKQEKKSDVAMLTEKLASRNGMPENPVPTPVQERLAALAKALDKAAGVGKDTSQPVPKAVEQADGTKATPFQRSLEQVGRSSATMAKPFATPIQTPMQSREWGNEVGQRLMMMVSSKLNSAQIQLTPRDMGPIDVKVSRGCMKEALSCSKCSISISSASFTSAPSTWTTDTRCSFPELKIVVQGTPSSSPDICPRDEPLHAYTTCGMPAQ